MNNILTHSEWWLKRRSIGILHWIGRIVTIVSTTILTNTFHVVPTMISIMAIIVIVGDCATTSITWMIMLISMAIVATSATGVLKILLSLWTKRWRICVCIRIEHTSAPFVLSIVQCTRSIRMSSQLHQLTVVVTSTVASTAYGHNGNTHDCLDHNWMSLLNHHCHWNFCISFWDE